MSIATLICNIFFLIIWARHIKGQCTTYKCADILYNGIIWGTNQAEGVDVSVPTNNGIQFLGCSTGNGCSVGDFFCTDSSTSLSFGSTSTTGMRAMLGPNTSPAGSATACCSSTAPRAVCNCFHDQSSADALCNQLGYTTAAVTAVTNGCPEIHWSGTQWTSDWVGSNEWGKSVTCTTPITCVTPQPTDQPTSQPTEQPTDQPSEQPTDQPTNQPTDQPTDQPTNQPTRQPTDQPTNQPTDQPTNQPTRQPTDQPTNQPTGQPTSQPTSQPTTQPTYNPTTEPSVEPTLEPTAIPSSSPTTHIPSMDPTHYPTYHIGFPTIANTEETESNNGQVTEEAVTTTESNTVEAASKDGVSNSGNFLADQFGKLWYVTIIAVGLALCCCIAFGITLRKKRKANQKKFNHNMNTSVEMNQKARVLSASNLGTFDNVPTDGDYGSGSNIGINPMADGDYDTTSPLPAEQIVPKHGNIQSLSGIVANMDNNMVNMILPAQPMVNNNMANGVTDGGQACNECGLVKDGKSDNDGNFYCNSCWMLWTNTDDLDGEDDSDTADDLFKNDNNPNDKQFTPM